MIWKKENDFEYPCYWKWLDLAHGLPTKYEHFLKYVEEYKRFINPSREEFVEENEQLVRLGQDFTRHFETLYDNHREIFNEFGKLVSNNVLLNYFCQIKIGRAHV